MKLFQPSQKKSTRSSLVFLLLIITAALYAGKPDIFLSTSAVTPRIGMVEQEEQLHWRTLLGYNQQFGFLTINSLAEYGTENNHFRNPFRLHTFNIGIHVGKSSLKVGRIAQWNAVNQGRIDGAELTVSAGRFGLFNILGGIEAVTDFSDTTIATFRDGQFYPNIDGPEDLLEQLHIYGSWSKKKTHSSTALYGWIEGLDEDAEVFVGTGVHTRIFGIRFSHTIVMNLNDSELTYARIRAGYKIGKNQLALNFRQKKYAGYQSWAWMDEPARIAPVTSLDVMTPLSKKIILWNQVGFRFSKNGNMFLRSTLKYDITQVSFLAGKVGETTMFGAIAGIQNRLKGALSYGGSLSFNAVDYGEIAELQNATGLYGWVGWSPVKLISIRVFGRMAMNPWFDTDGRGGVSIHATL